jgi:hypothetical protein
MSINHTLIDFDTLINDLKTLSITHNTTDVDELSNGLKNLRIGDHNYDNFIDGFNKLTIECKYKDVEHILSNRAIDRNIGLCDDNALAKHFKNLSIDMKCVDKLSNFLSNLSDIISTRQRSRCYIRFVDNCGLVGMCY